MLEAYGHYGHVDVRGMWTLEACGSYGHVDIRGM
jgi:hypothetical protein